MEPLKSCDKQLKLNIIDSESTGAPATKAFIGAYNNITTRPHIMVGTARSSAAMPEGMLQRPV